MTDTGMQLVIRRLRRVKINPHFPIRSRIKKKKKNAHLISLEHSGITKYQLMRSEELECRMAARPSGQSETWPA